MSAETDLIKRLYEEVWNKGNLAVVDEIYADSFTWQVPGTEKKLSREDVKKAVSDIRAAFPDWREKIEEIVGEGDKVIVRVTSSGTNTGTFQGSTPTKKPVSMTGWASFRIAQSKVVEQQGAFPDVAGLLQQLGAMQHAAEQKQGILSFISSKLTISNLIGFLVFIALGFLIYGVIWRSESFVLLRDVEVARGLITFLIAIATVALALILTLAVLIGESSDIEKRFTQGKEVLTVLIGVLGTIVGFYFGKASVDEAQNPQVTSVRVSNPQPNPGGKVTLIIVASGGKPPYNYSVRFDPKIVKDIENGTSEDGWIIQEVSIPPEPPPKDIELDFQISIKDRDGKPALYDANNKLLIKKAT